MIDLLIPSQIVDYDLAQPPGYANAGGGMGVKYARVAEALSRRYTVRRISTLEEVRGDIVMVDPLWFYWEKDLQKTAEEFLYHGFERILVCGSEQNLTYWPAGLRHRLVVEEARWITHNSEYQRNLFRACGLFRSQFLCDPVPEHIFYPAPKVRRIYASGQISWEKRIGDLVELYGYLQGSDIETCYIGSATTWGDDHNPEALSERFQLQAALEEVTDVFLGNVSQAEAARWSNTSLFHVQVAEHDCSCQNQQEAAMGGALLFGLAHPINTERPVQQFTSVADCAQAIVGTDSDVQSTTYDHAMSQWSYEAYLDQFQRIIGRN